MNLNKKQIFGLSLGIIGLVVPLFLEINGLSDAGHVALGIFFLAAAFWMFEPVPIYATSLVVIFLQVLLLSKEGIMLNEVSSTYSPDSYTSFIGTLANPIIILFLGGFVLADTAVKFDLDKNLTRILLSPFGSKPSLILLGLMLVTATLSAFMSNTATTAMMMTVVIPIIVKIDADDPFKIAVGLSIPFAANIGGIATPIGTPPNAVVIGSLQNQGISIAFGEWMLLATPLVLMSLFFAWRLLLMLHKPTTSSIKLNMTGTFQKSRDAIILYVVFGLTIVLWVTESLHGVKSSIVALLPVVVLTVTSVISKEDIRKLPWEVLWLVAGGISLGLSMKNTGLAEWIVTSISWDTLDTVFIILAFAGVAIGLSNFLSNTVTATILAPLAISLATSGMVGEGFSLVIISVVIGVGASHAMMFPISTPPNAIAISTGIIETKHLIKSGFIIGLIGLALVVLYALFIWPLILNQY